MSGKKTSVFLAAEWRWLAMLNYPVAPEVLLPIVPAGTELDLWEGRAFVSMVGFMFLKTRVKGVPIPFHQNFEEVNLRFYVRRKTPDGWRRGVVFIKEIVPRPAIAFVARTFYNENYVSLPMSHQIHLDEVAGSVAYQWRFAGREHFLRADVAGRPQPLPRGSMAEFIAEHYWGYARQRDGTTMEYEVEHPPWNVWAASSASLDCDVANLYGREFARFLEQPPVSAFVADGSSVIVRSGTSMGF